MLCETILQSFVEISGDFVLKLLIRHLLGNFSRKKNTRSEAGAGKIQKSETLCKASADQTSLSYTEPQLKLRESEVILFTFYPGHLSALATTIRQSGYPK